MRKNSKQTTGTENITFVIIWNLIQFFYHEIKTLFVCSKRENGKSSIICMQCKVLICSNMIKTLIIVGMKTKSNCEIVVKLE